MKKIIALLLAAVMVMCLFAGCASSGSKVIKIGVFAVSYTHLTLPTILLV